MATLANIIEDVLIKLEGYVGDTDVYGSLAANITADATSFTVLGASYPDGSGFSTGLIEVGSELMYVQSIDRTTNTFSGVMRGFRGTTAVAHNAGVGVRNNPRIPRISVVKEINNTISSLNPKIRAVATTEITLSGSKVQYDLPANTLDVISVSMLIPGASNFWKSIKRWTFDNTGASNSTNGKVINIGEGMSGRKVQITYIVEPSQLVNSASDFTTTGLPGWVEEIVILGTCWRLASFIDAARVSQTSAEQKLINGANQINSGGSGTSMAKYFLGMYDQQLKAGEFRQAKEFPATKHYIF